jgi:hypothetical protein
MLRRVWPLALICVFLAALLASRWLTFDLLYIDEWWSIFKSGGDIYGPLSPAEIWDRIVTVDPGGMGAGYYLALGGWQTLIGSPPFAVRMFSLLLGALTIAMTYRIGTDWFSRRVGLFAAVLIASSAFFVNFMHEARAYTLVALMACLVVYTYWHTVTVSRPRWFHYAALTLALAGLAYSHYVALSMAAVIGVYHLVFVRKDRRWLVTATSMLAAAVLYIPWIGVMLEVVRRGADDTGRQASSMAAGEGIGAVAEAFSNGSPAFLVLLLAVGCWLFYERRQVSTASGQQSRAEVGRFRLSTQHFLLLLFWLTVGLGAALSVNAAVPFLVHLRYLIFLWPALAIGCALGIEALRRRGVPAALIAGVWVVFGIGASHTPDFMRAQFGEIYRAPAAGVNAAVALLEGLARDDDLVLYHIMQPGYEQFGLFIEDYLSRTLPETVAHAQTEFMNNAFGTRTDVEYRADMQTVLANRERVWILDVPEIAETQRTRTLTDTLAENYANCGNALIRDDAVLTLYARRPEARDFRQNAPYVFGDDTTGLARMHEISSADSPDAPLNVTLGWLANGPLRNGTHSVAVHVVDANGVVIAQDDYPLPAQGYGCRLSVFTELLLEGEHSIYVTVYNPQTLEPLPADGVADGRIRLH